MASILIDSTFCRNISIEGIADFVFSDKYLEIDKNLAADLKIVVKGLPKKTLNDKKKLATTNVKAILFLRLLQILDKNRLSWVKSSQNFLTVDLKVVEGLISCLNSDILYSSETTVCIKNLSEYEALCEIFDIFVSPYIDFGGMTSEEKNELKVQFSSTSTPLKALANFVLSALEISNHYALTVVVISLFAEVQKFPLPALCSNLTSRFPQKTYWKDVCGDISNVLEDSKIQASIQKYESTNADLEQEKVIAFYLAVIDSLASMKEIGENSNSIFQSEMKEAHDSSLLSSLTRSFNISHSCLKATVYSPNIKARRLNDLQKNHIAEFRIMNAAFASIFSPAVKSFKDKFGPHEVNRTPLMSKYAPVGVESALLRIEDMVEMAVSTFSTEQNSSTCITWLSLYLGLSLQVLEVEDLNLYHKALKKAGDDKEIVPSTVKSSVSLNSFRLFLKTTITEFQGGLDNSHLVLKSKLDAQYLTSLRLQLYGLMEPKNQVGSKAKIPKGTQDFDPKKMLVREAILTQIVNSFKKFGASQIDTPVFELKETLVGKYGEDQKLIYDLKDQGGEKLSLRYDLTVPFARYVGSKNVDQITRFHIGKVYRRDEPQLAKGRYREFYQIDLDVAGTFDPMVPDAEILGALVSVYSSLKGLTGEFEIKVNHRKLLDGFMAIAGVPESKFRTICSSIDKLDKETWEFVENEMIHVKNLNQQITSKLKKFVMLRGQNDILDLLSKNDEILNNPSSLQGISELRLLWDYLVKMNLHDSIKFDMSLARGLDYYTGPIFEVVLTGASVGSVGGGGRYDYLLGKFRGKDVPSVGASIGVERLFAIADQKLSGSDSTETSELPEAFVDVFIASVGSGLMNERMKLASILRKAGLRAKYEMKDKAKLTKQLTAANDAKAEYVVVFGEDELKEGTVKVRQLSYSNSKTQEKSDGGDTVKIVELVDFLKSKLKVNPNYFESHLSNLISNE
eukprot:GHVP01066660.1.p1 GENE.GHVP01066660.1~~GHVP01066660.1.p1  ORF type:complete len:965 (+),score=189.71 GHVP01066660.1:1497-4391(+)